MNKKLIFSLVSALVSTQAFAEINLNLNPVVVTATRTEANSFDLPVAIDVVDKSAIRDGQLQMTLSESLIRVPGITAQNRTHQAQDPTISTRGFGARSSFGVRGVRLYVDGIPLTMPDGQGQPGVVDLSAIKSVEVMRGPFSALYGNSSGGVIQMISDDAPKTPEIGAGVMFGSYGTKREIMNAAGTNGNLEYMLNVSNFDSDGYRDHSRSNKQQATAKFKLNISESTKLTSLVNWFEQDAKDPTGLTKADVRRDPKSVVPAATNANLNVSRRHTQVGFNLEHRLDENNQINVMAYGGQRDNYQVLPTNTLGTNARASVIARDFYGTDVRWDNKGVIVNMPYTLSLGLNYGKSKDARSDNNILSNGARIDTINRDEDNDSQNFDQYAQGKLSILENVDLHAGLRRTKVKLEVKDKFLTGTGNLGDNSGSLEYQKTTPVLGAVWKVNPALNLYANYGEGFETPTFVEVAYESARTGGSYTPNYALKPSESKNYEVGAKAFINDFTRANVTLFRTTTENEIVADLTDGANRSSFTNANKTKRQGLEMSIDSQLKNNVSLYGSYTYLDAKFDSEFAASGGRVINSGNYIPGTYKSQIYAEVAWKVPSIGFFTALETRHNSKVYVNDTNSDSANSYTIFNIRAGLQQQLNNWRFSEYVRIENIGDKDYIGSVRVNDFNNERYYEPAAGRNWLMGLNATYRF